MSLPATVKNFIQTHSLIAQGSTVVIGVSGGCDSLVLAHTLNELKHELGCQLHLAHFNHNLRASSIKDEKCVKAFAVQNNIPLHIGQWQNPPSTNSSNIEEKARTKRQQFFKRIVKKINAGCVALAHHKQDVAETVLMKLMRGSGANGLQGILPKRTIDNIVYIRPLLSVTKEAIIKFAKREKIKYCQDPTNTDTRFLRNKIRRHLIPKLKKEYNQNIEEGLYNTAQILSDDFAFLKNYSDKLFAKHAKLSPKRVSLDTSALSRLHTAVQRLMIRQSYATLTGSDNRITFSHIDKICNSLQKKELSQKYSLPKGVTARISKKKVTFSINA